MILNNRYSLHTKLTEMSYRLRRKVYMVEVGLGFGDFASHLLESCGDSLTLVSIESWRGRFMKRRMTDCRDEVMGRMDKYINNKELYNYEVIELDSTAASTVFDDNMLDCVYIDAGHDYRNCINDLKCWYPKLMSGGIFSGHDYKISGVPGVRRAVDEFFNTHSLKLGVTEDVNPNPSWYCVKP